MCGLELDDLLVESDSADLHTSVQDEAADWPGLERDAGQEGSGQAIM